MYAGKIIPINSDNNKIQYESPALPVCHVEGQKHKDKKTIIKHGKGSIRFKLPVNSETKQRRKQRRRMEKG